MGGDPVMQVREKPHTVVHGRVLAKAKARKSEKASCTSCVIAAIACTPPGLSAARGAAAGLHFTLRQPSGLVSSSWWFDRLYNS